MKQFLLGVGSALALLGLASVVLVLSLGSGVDPAAPPPSPAPSGVRLTPPSDLRRR